MAGQATGEPKRGGRSGDKRSDKDFYKEPGGGLIDPQGEPKHDDATTEPTEELPPKGLGKKSPDQELDDRDRDEKPRHRGG